MIVQKKLYKFKGKNKSEQGGLSTNYDNVDFPGTYAKKFF